jgi:uncharacterized protein
MLADEIKTKINMFLSPSAPIQTEERLRGRAKQLHTLELALNTPGRNAFVYGVRGVGKTSLAQTAAFHLAPSDPGPHLMSCDRNTTFGRFVRETISKIVGQHPLEHARKVTTSKGGKLYIFEGSKQHEIEMGNVPLPESVNEAVALLEYARDVVGKTIVVVVDEFDRITSADERAMFGDLIKQLGDQSVDVKLIFCGVGRSLDDLLAGHESCFRYIEGVELERLGISPSIEIIGAAAKALRVDIDDGYRYRIAQVSDGFPHYVHLIGQRMFWNYFTDEERVGSEIRSKHFEEAILQATESVEPHLRSLYAQATEKYANSDDYELTLWAAASHPDLRRKATDIYDAYCVICNELKRPSLDRNTFNNRLNPLKDKAHGEVLVGTRQGWYEFREPMLRGLCRLRAMAKHKLNLGKEYYV